MISAPLVFGQQLMTNNQGEKIVVFPDGSWRPAEPGDSVWISASLELSREASQPRNPGQASSWDRLQARIRQEQEAAQSAFRSATNAQFKAGEALRNARANAALLDPVAIRNFEEAHESSMERLAMARKREQAIARIAGDTEKLKDLDLTSDDARFRRLAGSLSDYLKKFVPGAPVFVFDPVSDHLVDRTTDNRRSGRAQDGDVRSREPLPCRLATASTDPASGLPVQETLPADLFFYTDPELRTFFKNKDLITSRVWFSRLGTTVFLHLEFEIASANSQASFGGIAQGALVRLKTMDGELLTLYNTRNDRGRIDTYSGHTLYGAQYTLSRDEVRKLRDSELDKIRVLWITGFEDYEIIYPDVVRQQLDCLLAE